MVVTGVESLTPSERRVVDLAVNGGTNRDIAQELYLGAGTLTATLPDAGSAAYDYEPQVGSLISVDHKDRVAAHVEDARAMGATVLCGGKRVHADRRVSRPAFIGRRRRAALRAGPTVPNGHQHHRGCPAPRLVETAHGNEG